MNLGAIIGAILLVASVLFAVLGFKASNSYHSDVAAQVYAAATFSCLVFGTICYELGKCSAYLGKIAKAGTPYATSGLSEKLQNEHDTDKIDEENSTICRNCNQQIPIGSVRCPHCKWIC